MALSATWSRRRRATEILDPLPEALDFARLPRHQQLARVEDRGKGAADDANQKGKHELLGRFATEEIEGQQREDDRHRRVEGPHDRLCKTVIDDLFERRRHAAGQVLADSVEDDDGVVDRETDDCKQGSHEQGVNLRSGNLAHNRKNAEHNQHVVEHAYDRGYAVQDWVLRIPEGVGDVEQDADRCETDREEGSARDVPADARTN